MDLLRQPAHTALYNLLLELLGKAAQCADRLTDSDDNEALHDFRVALRRLNANQRAYRKLLSVKLGKGVRSLARTTNGARDREVQLDWLRLQRKESDAHARPDLDALIDKLERAHEMERLHAYPHWQTAFAQLAEKLRHRLESPQPGDVTKESFAQAAGRQIHTLSEKLRRSLCSIEKTPDDNAVHAARIIGKHLRYLLEPLAAEVPGVPSLIKRLKVLQDLLGEIHDCQVRLDDFAGRRQAELVNQYAALQRGTAERRAQLMDEFQTRWLGEHVGVLNKDLQRVIARLEQ